MSRLRTVPWLIVLIGVGFAAFTGWSFYRAAIGTSAVTDSAYYSHGLRYNQTLLEQRAADSLGWQMTASRSGEHLLAVLKDGNHRPVSGARGVLTMFRPDLARPEQIPLKETAPGHYQVALPPAMTGELTAEIAFDREGARLQRRLLLAPGAR